MRVYPKVPRYDHPTVDTTMYEADDLTILEKLDGSNFRFMLYEERFHDEYTERIQDRAVSDGDVLFGAKKSIRGTLSQPSDAFDGSFRRAVSHLRTTLNTDAIRQAQDTRGPLVFYAENMIPHTLDYNYEEDPPPALLGFDIYAARDGPSNISGNPFEQDFTGFLPRDEAWELFTSIGLETVPVLSQPSTFNAAEYDVPKSAYRDGQAEGVVIRSDKHNARTKVVTEDFKELNKERWGKDEADAEGEAEVAAIRLCTDARVRKAIHALVQDEGLDPNADGFEDAVARVVYADIWAEEWPTIKEFNITVDTETLFNYVQERTAGVIERVSKTAAVNDVNVVDVWQTDGTSRRKRMRPNVEDEKESLESLADEVLTEEALETVIEQELDRAPKPSDIDDLYNPLYDAVWKAHWERIATKNIAFTPTALRNAAAKFTANNITGQQQ